MVDNLFCKSTLAYNQQFCFVVLQHNKFSKINKSMYLLTEWEDWMGKYLARGLSILTKSQIFSSPAAT